VTLIPGATPKKMNVNMLLPITIAIVVRLCWLSDVGKQSSSSPLFGTVRDWEFPKEAFADSPRPTGFKNFAFTATMVSLTPFL